MIDRPATLAFAAATNGTRGGMVVDLVVILSAAALVSLAFRRLRLATIPGYLITGALLGLLASLFGNRFPVLVDPESIAAIAGLATILLLFTIGLHMDLSAIGATIVPVLLVGIVSTLAVVGVMWPVGMLFGLSAPAALVVAMALSMSSTAVGLRILQQRRETHRTHGRIIFGVLVVQDLMVPVFLALLPPLASWAGLQLGGAAGQAELAAPGPRPLRLVIAGALALAGIAGLIGFGRWLLPRLLHEAAKDTSAEVMLVLSAAAALGAAVVTGALGFSPELGAFLAGFLLASTPFRAQLSGQLAPLRDLFMAVFFTTVGLKMDLAAVAQVWWAIPLALIALLAIKGLTIAATTWAAGASAGVAGVCGLCLAQGGEFSLVVLGAAGGPPYNIVPPTVQAGAIAVVVLSLIVTPWLFTVAERLPPRLGHLPHAPWIDVPALREATMPTTKAQPDAAPDADSAAARGHVIVAGFGVVGRAIADRFEVGGTPYLVVELNPATVRRQTTLGRSITYGDISNHEVLEAARIHDAIAVVLTIPDDETVLRACRVIREMNPGVFIAARTSYLSSAFQATTVGADDVTVMEVATAEAMARQVIRRMGERVGRPVAST